MPLLHLLVGPNGSGKSTYARDVLIPVTRLPFINADEIAARQWPDASSAHAYEAARLAEQLRRRAIEQRTSFISETVFSHPSKVDLVAAAVDAGYLVHLHVMLVPVELSIVRVGERVRRGGHDVPESKIRERHERLWSFVSAAASIADHVEVFDNGSASAPFRLCATLRHGRMIGEPEWPAWAPPEVSAWR